MRTGVQAKVYQHSSNLHTLCFEHKKLFSVRCKEIYETNCEKLTHLMPGIKRILCNSLHNYGTATEVNQTQGQSLKDMLVSFKQDHGIHKQRQTVRGGDKQTDRLPSQTLGDIGNNTRGDIEKERKTRKRNQQRGGRESGM